MTSLPGMRLNQARLRFDPAIPSKAASVAFQGLKKFGPYDNSAVQLQRGSVLFVFPDSLIELARTLWKRVVTGSTRYPGFHKMFGVPWGREHTQDVEVQCAGAPLLEAGATYRSAIEQWAQQGNRADLAVVVVPESSRREIGTPYYEAKAALADLGVPSQMVTAEMLESEERLEWAAADIALASFAKLGGIPWVVDAPRSECDVIVGVGRSDVPTEGEYQSLFGYAVTFVSNGMYRSTWASPPAADRDTYRDRLTTTITSALKNDLDEEPRRIVVHLASKTGRDELTAAQNAVQALGLGVDVALLRVDDSSAWDMADTATDDYGPPKGTVAFLSSYRCLLQCEQVSDRGAPRGPLLIELHKQSSVPNSAMEDLVRQVFRLTQANWRGFKSRPKPATLVYGEQLASLVGHMSKVESWNGDRMNVDLARRPWFL